MSYLSGTLVLLANLNRFTLAVGKAPFHASKKEEIYKKLQHREYSWPDLKKHPNIIPYHHAWIEPTKFSSWVTSGCKEHLPAFRFGPPINALHVLMMYATAGNLDSFLLTRSHSTQPSRPDLTAGDIADGDSIGKFSTL